MKEIKDYCPFCSYKAEIHHGPHNDYVDINCPHCGNYRSNEWAIHSSDIHKNKDKIPVLSFWIRQKQNEKDRVILDRDVINEILAKIKLPGIQEQCENLIKLIGENVKKPDAFYIEELHIVATIIGANDEGGVKYILKHLENSGIIKSITDSEKQFQAYLTVEGWIEFEKIKMKIHKAKLQEFNFKRHKISKDEKLWLTELLKFNFDKIDARSVKVNLVSKLSANFNSAKIDFRFVKDNRVTLLGLWYIQPNHHLIEKTHTVIEQIKLMIKIEPKLEQIESKVISSILEIAQRDVQIIFTFLFDLGFCNGGGFVKDSKILEKINFQPDQDAFDKILYYSSIEDALEKFYNQYARYDEDIPIVVKSNKTKRKIALDENIWDQIFNEYNISKQTFGKKINFVTDQYKRKIIFRDVENAFLLYKNGFSKPAITLAGGVIEELLRQYLISKNIKPSNNTFDEYIKSCEKNGLLKAGVSRLSDSIRHFRNLVHLQKENSRKESTTNSMASGAVSSIFTIINEF